MATTPIRKLDVAGTFECEVIAPEYGWFDESSKGSKYIKIPCKVIEPGIHEGKRIAWIGYLTSKAYETTEKILSDVFGDKWTWTKIPFAGMKCVIVAEEEEYNGKTTIKARYLNAVGGPKRSADDALAISNSIAKSLPSRGTTTSKPELATGEEDEIPF
jgi:hypothetical protein